MTGFAQSIDPSRLAGAASFAAAAMACGYGALRARSGRAALWWTLAAAQSVCAVEVVAEWRYRLHADAVEILQARGAYSLRGNWQATLLIAVLLTFAAAGALASWRHRRDNAGMAAIVGTTLALSLLGAETISLHRIDALMYAPLGPLVALAWMWIAAASAVAAAAISSPR